MAPKERLNLIEEIFEDKQRSGELLVARFRLVILLAFIPLIFALRFLLGYLLPSYWLLSIGKWIIMSAIAAGIYLFLQKGHYRSWIGFVTLFLDTAFVTTSIITLSFYTMNRTGVMQDPLVIIYYLIGFSGGIRYRTRYTVFSVALCVPVIIMLSWFDRAYHEVPVDYILVIDRLAFLLLISVMGLVFSRMLGDYIMAWYQMGEKHVKEIASLMEIGRKISSPEELAKTLGNIAQETNKLLQADRCFMVIRNGRTGSMEVITETKSFSCTTGGDMECMIGGKIMDTAAALAVPSKGGAGDTGIAAALKGSSIRSLYGLPVTVDGAVAGALVIACGTGRVFSEYDRTLLGVLSEQAAISIKNSRLLEQLKSESVYLHEELDYSSSFQNIIGQSRKMKDIFSLIEKAAKSNIPVIIRGESGTGKELVADALYALGPRRDKPFIKLNCSAIPSELLESELFGHEKGAFTGADRQRKGKFELAGGGTIFLDEIGDMSPKLQTKLLRVLQEGVFERIGGESTIRVDVRIITATNQNLEEKIRKGDFREDLFYRINGLPVYLPPLRERREDIPLLVDHFIRKYDYTGARSIEFTVSAMRFLTSREWRGNVRELENLVHRMLVMTDKNKISEKDLEAIGAISDTARMMDFYATMKTYIEDAVRNGCDVAAEIERIEREFLAEAYRQSKGNVRKAAEITGLPKSTLFNKLQKYGITD
ncbi:MAG TPA: sigma 54-interacting transcriptional regulator [Spirochaetota bacterium]|nr:sigma 54-interacting transcriptional regulator [Spirochaetota bacterium]HPC39811.1 sigma 54-interacting transcriptional regulator [Spirochaetota bacterium]HPL16323.1 sigma 54-interacting transcriptional regulator [Spirochaetota bacterium]HQF09858.1 sigma 54-interacting transcriptional regulator [Spirochaetota bacterium]HQH98508.1 sigma 54-interacting transcriptional regulator [Spirochaetota bacterium]